MVELKKTQHQGKRLVSAEVKTTGELHPSNRNGEQNQPTKRKELVILRGITTSQINQALKATNPYPARVFLKTDNQEQDIPVFFRIKEKKESCQFHSRCSEDCRYKN